MRTAADESKPARAAAARRLAAYGARRDDLLAVIKEGIITAQAKAALQIAARDRASLRVKLAEPELPLRAFEAAQPKL